MLKIYDLGLTTYEVGKNKQLELYDYVLKNKEIDGALLFLELNPVITTAYSSTEDEIILSKEELTNKGIDITKVNRGGKTTVHGPGQMVCYPILNLEKSEKDLHKYLRNLEEVIINTLKDLGIKGKRKAQYTGVWVEDKKICAMGIHVKKWITTHGIALNNTIDLSLFDAIVPCGIKDFTVTSLSKLGVGVKEKELKNIFIENFKKVFDKQVI